MSENHSMSNSATPHYCPRCSAAQTPEEPECKCGQKRPPVGWMQDALVGQVLGGRHHVTRRLGAGGFGTVYLAIQQPFGAKRAVKVLNEQVAYDEQVIARFEREATVLGRLQSKEIVGIVDYGIIESIGSPYLVMEFAEGLTLQKLMENEGPLSAERSLRIIRQIATALHSASQQNILHRDLKPDNVIVHTDPITGDEVKVLDLGIAKILGAGLTVTSTRGVMGTPEYMAPERWTASHEEDARSDLWSLGVILYVMLARRLPFPYENNDIASIIHRICKLDYPPVILVSGPESINQGALGLLDMMLAKIPHNRPESAGHLVQLIDEILTIPGSTASHDQANFQASTTPKTMEVTVSAEAKVSYSDDSTPDTNLPAEEVPRPKIPSTRKSEAAHHREPPKPSKAKWIALGFITFIILCGVVAFVVYPMLTDLLESVTSEDQSPKVTKTEQETNQEITTTPQETVKPAPDGTQISEKDATSEPLEVAPVEKQVLPPPEGMVGITAGSYPIGCHEGDNNCYDDERPAQEITVNAFAIMKTEVLMEDYDMCVAEKGCTPAGKGGQCNWQKSTKENHPINCVDWHSADAYCKFKGWRLPTEEEWEIAARGKTHSDYPWGNEPPDCDHTTMSGDSKNCTTETTPSGSKTQDASWSGAMDLGGNVREWVASDYGPYGEKIETSTEKVNRGGSWKMASKEFSTSHTRQVDSPDENRPDLGFRCAAPWQQEP